MGPWGALALLALLGAGGAPFELREALRALRAENARLRGAVSDLSRALGQLRARLRDPRDPARTPEPPEPPLPPRCRLDSAAPGPQPLGGPLVLGAATVAARRLLLP